MFIRPNTAIIIISWLMLFLAFTFDRLRRYTILSYMGRTTGFKMDNSIVKEGIITVLAVICMVSSLCLFIYTCHIALHVLFDFRYNVPLFVTQMRHYLEYHHDLAGIPLRLMLVMPFVILTLIFGYFAKVLTDMLLPDAISHKASGAYIDSRDDIEMPAKPSFWHNIQPFAVILSLILSVVVFLFLLEYLIDVDIPF